MPQIEVETHKVASPDVVVPTLDTVRHEALLYTWLAEHKPLVLCGPPGSGKTMTLFSALRALPDMEVRDETERICCSVLPELETLPLEVVTLFSLQLNTQRTAL